MTFTPEQIKHMVDRFLGWKLPANFSPDAGISFKPAFNEHTAHPMRHEPSGTNLFDATQAYAMVKYMVAGGIPPVGLPFTHDHVAAGNEDVTAPEPQWTGGMVFDHRADAKSPDPAPAAAPCGPTIKEKPPAKSCGTCALWGRDGDPPYCKWEAPDMPFWATISDGDHGIYTEETDGRRCPTWVALTLK